LQGIITILAAEEGVFCVFEAKIRLDEIIGIGSIEVEDTKPSWKGVVRSRLQKAVQ
jgi:hypothetical protein